ncbi:unnamed protein product [Phytophthora lilii]|uniref:peptidylprolyl isomerase n=1 Tax=Phytophthora lilii TaxID=2077276 RepID=A0A9W6TIV5_9STRA|nr:unnamed protein product [Phytophthora lilii]
MATPIANDPAARRLVEGLQCDLDIYNEFIESEAGQDIFIMATLCESRIVYLKNARAGWYGPVPQADLFSAMCSEECLRSDELHKKAMSLSRCTCAEVSAETFVRHDFCLESSARLLCTHLNECGHWGCQLEDFNCLRYEWDHLYPCAGTRASLSAIVMVIALALQSYTLPITTMTTDRRGGSVRWSLYRDATCSEAACVASGSIDADLVQPPRSRSSQSSPDSAPNSTGISLDLTGIQLAPELQRRAWDLLARERGAGNEAAMDVSDDAFPIQVEDLNLGPRAAEWGLQDGKALLYCKLELDAGENGAAVADKKERDWFSWKLSRAAEYRVRGNEAFKQESYGSAVRLYKRALAWLEPPAARSDATLDTKIEYSTEELQLVNPVAVACYANMATCYSKLNGDGDVDRCVAAATSALELDDSHVKARFRRSQAYVSTKEFGLAIADLTKLCDLEPSNKLFRSALTRAQVAKTQLRKKQQSAFANIFDK